MAGIAPPFQVPKVHISSHFSPPPACARRRNVHQSCRYSQVHTRRRSLARMSRPLMRAISADAMLRRAGAAVARHPPPQKSANFCRLFGVWRRGGRRRAGNIPASDPDTARRPSAVSRAMPSQTLAPRPRRRGWRERDGRHRASVPGTESSHKFTLFTPPACARRRNAVCAARRPTIARHRRRSHCRNWSY